jgi:hypothetical protein
MSKPLSPQAQAVLDAFGNATGSYAWVLADEHRGIAAALRAVAKELGPKRKLEPGYIFSASAEQWHHEFQLEAERKLLAIAGELESAA